MTKIIGPEHKALKIGGVVRSQAHGKRNTTYIGVPNDQHVINTSISYIN